MATQTAKEMATQTVGDDDEEFMDASTDIVVTDNNADSPAESVLETTSPQKRSFSTQTPSLTNHLVSRYVNHIHVIQQALNSKGFHWGLQDFIMKDPPGQSVIPVIENIAALYLSSEDPTSDIIIKEHFSQEESKTRKSPPKHTPRKTTPKHTTRNTKLAHPFPEK